MEKVCTGRRGLSWAKDIKAMNMKVNNAHKDFAGGTIVISWQLIRGLIRKF
jgi:hypothetical protein